METQGGYTHMSGASVERWNIWGAGLGVLSLQDHVRRVIRTLYDSTSFQKRSISRGQAQHAEANQDPASVILTNVPLDKYDFCCCLKRQWSLIVFSVFIFTHTYIFLYP